MEILLAPFRPDRSGAVCGLHLADAGVELFLEQHKGVPVSWFGETEYFIVEVRVVE